ncbi:MAG: EF-hand domain-containing protein [Candidatus Melainabacteria bacterium]|nr:EF-hand domain-containing protein [Candidatus Melainabacteria bacterium]
MVKRREDAAQQALADIRWLIQGTEQTNLAAEPTMDDSETYLDGPTIIALLEKNFAKLDPNNDGISREEIMVALMNPQAFSPEEYEVLRLVTKYFDTIINLSEDEDGGETKISRYDMLVLEQFLVHSNMTLKELHDWCAMSKAPGGAGEDTIGPPPLSGT